MTSWRPDFNPDHLYFVTTGAYERQHIFAHDVEKRILVDNLDCFRLRKKIKLFAFVIMPNHIHLMLQCTEMYPLASAIRDFKKLTADRLLRYWKAIGAEDTLAALENLKKAAIPQNHFVWENGYLAKDVFSPDFLRQKMDYIHNNPCQAHWQLVSEAENYIWSSARYYLLQQPALIPLDNAIDLLL